MYGVVELQALVSFVTISLVDLFERKKKINPYLVNKQACSLLVDQFLINLASKKGLSVTILSKLSQTPIACS